MRPRINRSSPRASPSAVGGDGSYEEGGGRVLIAESPLLGSSQQLAAAIARSPAASVSGSRARAAAAAVGAVLVAESPEL